MSAPLWTPEEIVAATGAAAVGAAREAHGVSIDTRTLAPGDLFFAISNLSRKLGIDPESALRRANEKFTKRFTAMEDRLHAQGRSVHNATLEEMEREWEIVKGTSVD